MEQDDGRLQRRIAGGLLALLAPLAVLQAILIAPVLAAAVGSPAVSILELGAGRAVAAAVAVVIVGGLLSVLTLVGAAGACLDHRWGWGLGIGVALLWIPTAGAPLALIALGLLVSVRPVPAVSGATSAGG